VTSRPLARRVSIVSELASGVGVVDGHPEGRTKVSNRGVLEHRLVAIAVVDADDRAVTDELVNADGLPSLSSTKR
jgi:hypothetical protein